MTALAPNRLHPLLARLGSDNEGERIATLRALDRQLARAGLSWTDLADRLTAAPVVLGPVGAGDVLRSWCAVATWIVARPKWTPSPREADFVGSMCAILSEPSTQPTPKQAKRLAGIAERLGGTLDVAGWPT